MGSSRFSIKVADEESKRFPHEFPRSFCRVKGDRSVRYRAPPVADNAGGLGLARFGVWLGLGFGLGFDLVRLLLQFKVCAVLS